MKGKANKSGEERFSVRLPPDLRTHIRNAARDRGLKDSEYIRDLVRADLLRKRSRGRGRQNVILRQELAKIHAAIIACGNQIVDTRERGHCRRSDCEARSDQAIAVLKDQVTAIFLLEDKVRGK